MTEAKPPKRKLIEVALPLEAINVASAREKSIRHGHPSTLHLWWARRPLAACRAVLFASLVDDPSSDPDRFPTPKAVEDERTRLFEIIERLVQWENSTNEAVLAEAHTEILRSTNGNPPPVLDPFCGGGSIPLEAQRLGLTAYASDLNPVAVLITKALIEIPPRFNGMPPVHPDARRGIGASGAWMRAGGLAEDVRRYGAWMREEAERRIGHLYPSVRPQTEQAGGEATVVAWIWARTVSCPNPACGAQMPLVRTFDLSTKKGKGRWALPIVDHAAKAVSFAIGGPDGKAPAGTVGRNGAQCIVCSSPVPLDYVRSESRAGRMGAQLMAIVAEGQRSRVYLPPTDEHRAIAASAEPTWGPEEELADWPGHINVYRYGLTRFRDLFTPRQLVALTTFSDLVGEARTRVQRDTAAVGDREATAYGDAVATYLAFAVSKMADRGSTICTWFTDRDSTRNTFARQAIPMTWDFAELNVLLSGTGSFEGAAAWTAESVEALGIGKVGTSVQADATHVDASSPVVISTDPPYYDNIGYSDLSDFFYVWLRRSLSDVYPDLFGTLLTPKAAELVATPYRFGGSKAMADKHFERGLGTTFDRLRAISDPSVPVTVYYAFKQAESDGDEGRGTVASTGWETMLEGLLSAGFSIDGTWPMRSELSNRMIASGTNALASSIVLVCRPRLDDSGITTRRDLVGSLKREMPEALRNLQHGNIAPVDLAQSAIGPGMAVFSRYSQVLETDGTAMRVRTALGLINQVLDEVLAEQEGEFDPDTRWAVAWYDQYGMKEAEFGVADVLARAKNTSVQGMVEAGIVAAGRGKVRLLARDEYDQAWDPAHDRRLPAWEAAQRLVHVLLTSGEGPAGELLAKLGGLGETARDLAYRLFQVAERKGWTDEARAYNALVVAWSDLSREAATPGASHPTQPNLGLE